MLREQVAKQGSASRQDREDIALAFVGCAVPDEPRFHSPAFSRAGNMFQQGLLLGLKRAGLAPSAVFSVRPIPSYPKASALWVASELASLPGGMRTKLVPFVNLTPFKQVATGLSMLASLGVWGWRNRKARHRVIYTYNLTVPPGLFTLLAARLVRAKAVVSLCDINEPGHTVPATLPFRLDFWIQRKLIPRFDGLVVVSDRMVEDFAPLSRHVRVEGGVRSEVFLQNGASPAPPPGDGRFVIAAAGTLDDVNGVLVILDAFARLKGDRYRLRLAGGGPLESEIREAARLDPRIEYLGLVSFAEVLGLYGSADVLINMRPTKTLNTKYFFPSKMMEYLGSGTPVITTCTGHIESEFGELVYLLRDETPRGLAELLEHVANLDVEERRDLGRRAREYMARHKTWDAQGRKVVRFLREAVLGIGPAADDSRADSISDGSSVL